MQLSVLHKELWALFKYPDLKETETNATLQ